MFTINLYVNNSPDNKIGKDLTAYSTLSGTLKERSSLIDPVITVQMEGVPLCNYAYISEFGRYYFIRNIISEVNGLWTLEMHVDVLESAKADLYQQTALIARQQNLYNLYLNDDRMAFQSGFFTVDKRLGTKIMKVNETYGTFLTVAGYLA